MGARRSRGIGSYSLGPKICRRKSWVFYGEAIKKPRSQGGLRGRGGQVGETWAPVDHTRGGVVIGNRRCICCE